MHFFTLEKWSHESSNFDTFQMFWWTFAKFLLPFSKLQSSFSSNFAWLCSVIKDNSSVLFVVKCYILCTKGTNHSATFEELSAQIKIHQILLIFETTNQFFFKFYITLSVSWDITPLYFFSWNFIYFQQKEPIKIQIWWIFTWAAKKSLKFCTLMSSCCKNHIKF